MKPVYLDHHATTPLDPRVFEEMKPYFLEEFGNAASRNHVFGWAALKAVDKARSQVADFLGAAPKEIVFTSGATESNNLALVGLAEGHLKAGDHVVVGNIEHKSVLDCLPVLRKKGIDVTLAAADEFGRLSATRLREWVTEKTRLISVMTANNEVGTLNPIGEIGKFAQEKNIFFHTDAVCAAGMIHIHVDDLKVDLLSLSGHKIHGPKGAGVLYIRNKTPRIKLEALLHGGGQERGLRSGTLNVPAIVGLGKACELALQEGPTTSEKIKSLRDRLERRLFAEIPDLRLNGHPTERLPQNLNVSFQDVDKISFFKEIKDLAVSTGAACTTASLEPSHVLKAMGLSAERINTTLRLSFGRFTTTEEIDFAAKTLIEAARRCRNPSLVQKTKKDAIVSL